jgi:lipopolysaccharide/colanic/teichoic acid biosynthesis glycosyltransferase
MYKFRSMKMENDGSDMTTWGRRDDDRRTKFGSLIRKCSIDELPQLVNVLKGDMSLVGPRPERPFFVDKFKEEIPLYMLKHLVRPGITGWAQVNGWRGDTSIKERIKCDIYYIENWTFLLDLKILFLTIFKGVINQSEEV